MAIHQIHSEIEIAASAEQVWAVLCDFALYPQWNPFIRSVVGKADPGSRLHIVVQPTGGRPMRFSPRVLSAQTGRELCWLGHFLAPGVFDGEHRFVIRPLGEGRVHFEQSERFRGLLVGPFRGSLDRDTKRGFAEMNRALKTRVEERARP